MKNEKDFEERLPEEEPETQKNNSKKRNILLFAIVFIVVFCAVLFGQKIYYNYIYKPEVTTVTVPTTAATTEALVENPIDFASLQEGNDEIYAYIIVEDTNVNHPIVQSSVDDTFYLHHSAEDKSYLPQGAIYTESCNHKNFNDPFTVIYGHNNYGDMMFTTLHYFEDADFFDSHPYFYIYTPDRKLTYQVVSAFKYDDRHIMNTNGNFVDRSLVDEFQEVIKNPDSSVKNVREQLDTSIDRNSKIVILSTCITNQNSSRYLVCGVLVKDEKTY